MQSHNTVCRIKFAINNNIDNAFYLRYCPDKHQVNVKIISKTVEHIPMLLEQVADVIGPAYNWEVQWNFVNTPKEIKDNIQIRKKVLKMFAANIVLCNTSDDKSADLQSLVDIKPSIRIVQSEVIPLQDLSKPSFRATSEMDRMASKVNAHISFHGAAPNFSDMSMKGMAKSMNYVKSVLGVQQISYEDVENIVRRVATMRSQ
jgi:hypothetical protein